MRRRRASTSSGNKSGSQKGGKRGRWRGGKWWESEQGPKGKEGEKWGEKAGRKGARKSTRKTLILVPLWFRCSLVAFQLAWTTHYHMGDPTVDPPQRLSPMWWHDPTHWLMTHAIDPAQHINFDHSHFPQKIPPKSPTWGPQNEFPGIRRIGVFCGNSPETLNFPESPGHPDFSTLGSPLSAFWGEMKLMRWALLQRENFPSQGKRFSLENSSPFPSEMDCFPRKWRVFWGKRELFLPRFPPRGKIYLKTFFCLKRC